MRLSVLMLSVFLFSHSALAYHFSDELESREKRAADQENAEIRKLTSRLNLRATLERLHKDKSLSPVQREEKIEAALSSTRKKNEDLQLQQLKGKPLFPCSLPKDASKLVPLHIFGETHHSEETAKVRSGLYEQVKKKALVLGLEGIPYGGKNLEGYGLPKDMDAQELTSYISGVEDNRTFWMGVLARLNKAGTARADARALNSRVSLSEQFYRLPSFPSLHSVIGKAIADTPVKRIADHAAASNPANIEQTKANLLDLRDKQYFGDHAEWPKFMREYMGQIITSRYGAKQLADDEAELKKMWETPHSTDFSDELLIRRRNVDIASSVAALYCRALEKGIPLHVVIGSAHSDGLERLLLKHFPELPLKLEYQRGTLAQYQKAFRLFLDIVENE